MKLRMMPLLCLVLMLGFAGSSAFGLTFDIRLTNGNDDAEQHLNNGSMDITSTDLEFPYEDAGTPSSTDEQLNMLRFVIPIPKGALITNAYVEFEVDETKDGSKPVNVIIEGELVPDAPAFGSAAWSLSNRGPWTAAKVKWSVPNWTKTNDKFQTPDLAAVIQEIIGQDGWASGNAFVLSIRDDKDNPSTGLRCAESVEGEATAAPLLHIEAVIPMATQPDPADGAQEVTMPLLQWTAGESAVMHRIYLGTSPELGAADLVAPATPAPMYFHAPGFTPGTTYYWRVDEVEADGVTVYTGNVWSFSVMPMTAHFPSPADQATDIKTSGTLKWTAGQVAMSHAVYLGTDKAAVEAGAASVKVAEGADLTYAFTGLNAFATYYWRVDEIDAAGAPIAGPVWSFDTVKYLPMSDAAVTLNYDNSVSPFVSQAELTGATDWTAYGLTDLSLQFTGRAAPTGGLTYDEATQTYTLTGAGADIWGNADQFHYAYQSLNGDGTMIARVVSIGAGSNTWAKGGVMIRQSLAAGSTHAYMPMTANSDGTAGNGASFQRRLVADLASTNNDSAVKVAPPYWVKIERKGADFSGYISPDGQTWTQLGTAQTIAMTDPVYIGLAVTSHAAGQLRTFTFDSVSTTGDVTPAGPFSAWDDIGITSNDPQPIYAAVEDAAGKVAVVDFGDPAATQITQPWTWKIPLTSFVGVDLTNVAKLYLGAGDLLSPVAGGSGVVTFNNVQVVKPVVLAGSTDVTAPGDNVKGVPNDGDWPAAETPWLAIDNNVNTKFLHFKGETQPTGIQIQVMAGPSIVTGLTFTTANDAPERDPVSFELYGSNVGIDGPYDLIASGPIVDFAGADAWPRFSKTTTPISFENQVAYMFYQVLFPAVRTPTSANSMQIAEVELISKPSPNIVWVTDAWDDDADGITDDQGWVDLLQANMYAVDYKLDRSWRTLDEAKLSVLNAADLVIVSRNFNSGDYNNGNERDQWNSVTAPLMLMSMHGARSSHWKWFNTTTIPTGAPAMKPVDTAHPAFAGVTLDANGQVQALVAGPDMTTSFPGTTNAGNGTVIATRADTGDVWIVMWAAGVEFYPGAGQIPAGPRMFFAAGTQEVPASGVGRGEMNLTDSGQALFLNLVDLLLE